MCEFIHCTSCSQKAKVPAAFLSTPSPLSSGGPQSALDMAWQRLEDVGVTRGGIRVLKEAGITPALALRLHEELGYTEPEDFAVR